MVVLELKVVEVYANGFIRPSKSPAGAPRQAGKGLILPEDFLLADASMVFYLQQCRHTVCVWRTYTAVDTLLVEGSVRKSASRGMSGPNILR